MIFITAIEKVEFKSPINSIKMSNQHQTRYVMLAKDIVNTGQKGRDILIYTLCRYMYLGSPPPQPHPTPQYR